jgi:hypothetical protein
LIDNVPKINVLAPQASAPLLREAPALAQGALVLVPRAPAPTKEEAIVPARRNLVHVPIGIPAPVLKKTELVIPTTAIVALVIVTRVPALVLIIEGDMVHEEFAYIWNSHFDLFLGISP